MIAFTVDDMTCGHCVATITRAVQDIDPAAKVRTELSTHRVEIDPGTADAARLADAIREAGYTPLPVSG